MSDKVLQLYHNDSLLMNDAIDRIIVEIYGIKKKCNAKMFLLTGVGSSVGTTSVSINLAIALASSGWKTLFIDCDMRKGTVYKRIGSDESDDIISLTEYLAPEDEQIQPDDIVNQTTYPLLNFITAGSGKDSPVRLLCNERMEKLISRLKDRYDYIIVDTPSINIVNDAEILVPLMDRYIMVAAINSSTKRQLADAKETLLKYSDKYAGLIINRMDMHQYRKNIKDYDYFGKENLERKHAIDMRKIQRRKKEKTGKKAKSKAL